MSDCCSVNPKSSTAPAVMACPVNGARSKQVNTLTVKESPTSTAFGNARHSVLLLRSARLRRGLLRFGFAGASFRCADLLVRVGAKATADPIPICYALGSPRRILRTKSAARVHQPWRSELQKKSRRIAVRARVKNPSGKCCLGDVDTSRQKTD